MPPLSELCRVYVYYYDANCHITGVAYLAILSGKRVSHERMMMIFLECMNIMKFALNYFIAEKLLLV